jgi:predicted O-methyltransferase YrrM
MARIESVRDKLTVYDPGAESGAFIERAYHPPSWATGYISRGDARFLYEMIEDLRPAKILEIGVASGVSTVLLLETLEALTLDAHLYSFDIEDRYYARKDLRLGEHIFERFGEAPEQLSLNPRVSSMELTPRLLEIAREPVDFTFIDAEHSHPWPCLDLLAILKAVKPGSWVALHDINLPNLAPEFQCYGPLRLFGSWPGERRVFVDGAEKANIGAIKLFDTVAENVDAILAVLRQKWDVHVNYWDVQPVYAMLKAAGVGRSRQLLSIHLRNMPPAERRQFFIQKAKELVRPLVGLPRRAQA